jgi:2-C-methyl-D-erythritol 4-phosphate cytidylyltransferase
MPAPKDFSLYQHFALLLLGGSGLRFGGSTPKQFVAMAGKPLFLYAAEVLEASPLVDYIVYVVPQGYEKKTEDLLVKIAKKPHAVVVGAATRQGSCYEGLAFLIRQGASKESLVLVQDGDRPHLKERYIQENYALAERYGLAVTAHEATDSVAISKEPQTLDGYIPRQEVYLLSTPQTASLGTLYSAEEKAILEKKAFTDEGSLLLAYTHLTPHLVRSEADNLKITNPEDLRLFEQEEKA